VFEREVDRADYRARTAQITEFVELSLSAGHNTRQLVSYERLKGGYRSVTRVKA
jgi:hypothetical protein